MLLFIVPPLLALALMILIWLLWGRESHQTIPVLYEPPKGLSILECGILLDDAVNTKDIALELYNLYLQHVLVLRDKDTYVLNSDLTEEKIKLLSPCQLTILQKISGSGQAIYTSRAAHDKSMDNLVHDQKQISQVGLEFFHKSYLSRLARKVNELRFELYDILTSQGYFPISPFEQRKPFFALGAVLLTGPLCWNIFSLIDEDRIYNMLPWTLVAGTAIAGIIIAYFSLFLVRKTEAGIKAKNEFLGLKEFIVTAESDRIKFVIENNIDAYTSLLPYAALFNSLEKWIEPLNAIGKNLDVEKFLSLPGSISAMDVDISLTEKSRWARAIVDLFLYGAKIIGGSSRRYKNTSSFDY